MATNPRLPEERDVHPKIERQLQPASRVPWVLVAIIVAAAILLAMIIWLPRTPRAYTPSGAQVPQQPTGQQIQLTNLKLTPAPTGGAVYIDGQIVNAGPTAINGVQASVAFKDANGATLQTVNVPVEGLVGGSNTATQNLAEAPIKPGEARPVRIAVNNVPQGWDHQMPSITIAAVTAAGNPGNDKLTRPILNKGQGQGTTGNKPQGSATEPAGSNAKSGGKPQE
jgi:hypothetical protein